MRPLEIAVKGFLPFKNEVVLPLGTGREPFAAVVHGPNGVGKSSIVIDAILFALFGQARKRPEGLINEQSKEGSVTLSFKHNDEMYVVQREIRKGKSQKLSLYTPAKDLTERLLTQTQLRLDAILGFTHDFLLCTSIAQQEEINILSNMNPSEREIILSQMLGLSIWERKRQYTNAQLRELKDAIVEKEDLTSLLWTTANEKEELDKALGTGEAAQIVLQADADKLDLEQQTLQKEMAEHQNLTEVRLERARLEERAYQLETQLADYKDIGDPVEINTEIALYKDKLEILSNIRSESQNLQTTSRTDAERIATHLSQVTRLRGMEKSVEVLHKVPCAFLEDTNIHDSCPLLMTGKEAQSEIKVFLLRNKVSTLTVAEEKLLAGIDSAKHREEEGRAAYQEATANYNTTTTWIATSERELELIKKRDVLQVELNDLRAEHLALGPMSLLPIAKPLSRLQDVTNELADIRQDLELQRGENIRNDERLGLAISKLNAGNARLNVLAEKAELHGIYKILSTAYDEIPSLLFTNAVPIVEDYANEVLAKIMPQSRMHMRALRETKSGTMQRTLDVMSVSLLGVREFEDLSGSEKFRQSLAFRIALARASAEMHGVPLNFFIIDEGFGALDVPTRLAVKQSLRDVAPFFDLFLMITHVDELKDTFENLITVSSSGIKVETQVPSAVLLDG